MIHSWKSSPKSVDDIHRELGFKESDTAFFTIMGQRAAYLERQGFKTAMLISGAKIISPAWNNLPKDEVIENLRAWAKANSENKHLAPRAEHLANYLECGGTVTLEALTPKKLIERLNKGSLLHASLDEVWLWGHRYKAGKIDEVHGYTDGHVVLVTEHRDGKFKIYDPYPTNLPDKHGIYWVDGLELVTAILGWDAMVCEVFAGH